MKNIYFPSLLYFFFLSTLFFLSCNIQEESEPQPLAQDEQLEGKVISAMQNKSVTNPYSLENMRSALEYLQQLNEHNAGSDYPDIDQISIVPTDLHVRFLPADKEEYFAMMQDSNMIYFDTPLSHKVALEEDIPMDATASLGHKKWLYTVVKSDFSFSTSLRYEILEELFLPESYLAQKSQSGHDSQLTITLSHLEKLSRYLTGNLPDAQLKDIKNTKGSARFFCRILPFCDPPTRWYPSGRVSLEIESGEIVGVPFVTVTARGGYQVASTLADENGDFTFDEGFLSDEIAYTFTYSNQFISVVVPTTNEDGESVVLNGIVKGPIVSRDGAELETKHQPGTVAFFWGSILKGAYTFHQESVLEIYQPPGYIRVITCPEIDCSATTMFSQNRLFSTGNAWDINIGRQSNSYDTLMYKTFEQLGRAAYWDAHSNIWGINTAKSLLSHRVLNDAWAYGVGNDFYQRQFGVPFYSGCEYSNTLFGRSKTTEILVRDLIDNATNGTCDIVDPIGLQGFTLDEIFRAFHGMEYNDLKLREIRAITNLSALKQFRENLKAIKLHQSIDISAELDIYFENYGVLP